LASFVVLMFIAAPNFDEQPSISYVLKNERIEPESKIDELWEWTTESDWELVERNYDPFAWSLNILESQ